MKRQEKWNKGKEYSYPVAWCTYCHGGSCSCRHLFRTRNMSKSFRFRRNGTHRTEPPKHHRGTSSKRAPEAMEREAWRLEDNMQIIILTRDAALERRISSTGQLKQIQQSLQLFVELGPKVHRHVRHDLINCWCADNRRGLGRNGRGLAKARRNRFVRRLRNCSISANAGMQHL